MQGYVIRKLGAAEQRCALRRRRLLRLPPFARLGDRRHSARRRRYAINLPAVSPEYVSVLRELQAIGVSTRTITMPPPVLESADNLLDGLTTQPGLHGTTHVPPGEHALDPTVFRWGLTEKHLDLAEHYIGLPVRYLGVEIKREAPGESSHQAIRRWHIDVEDRRMLKMIIYLSDVDDQSAPFEYVDSASTQRILFSRRDVRRPLPSADTFENIIFEEEIHRVTGPRLTVIYADTSHILHRVKTPTESERTSVTFVYASDTAFYAYPHFMPPRKALQELRPTLSSRQLRALGME